MFTFSDLSLEFLVLLGILSGVLSTFAYLPYITDTISRRTRPQRASWLIWSVLGSIAFCSQLYEGATASLWFAGVQVTGTIVVFVLSIGLGVGGFFNRQDCFVLLGALAGLVLWYFTETAVYALCITISISLLGGSVTVLKAFRDPQGETMSTWFLSLIASACAIVSVGALDWVILAYPLYLFTLNGAIVVAMLLGQMRESEAAFDIEIGRYPKFA
jgi:hypothetical protein